VRNKVTEDMAYINEMIRTNKQELEDLRTKLKRSSFKLDDVEKTLAQLTKQLNEESAKVARLQITIMKKDSVITKLGTAVDSLGKNVEELASQNEEKQGVIKEQDQAINSAWYAIGSRKELRDNKIVTSDGIFSAQKVLQADFNKNYFVKVDARNTRSIPLYSTSKARILTNHSKTSYTLEKENENYVLVITNPAEFWSVSKYLVVEVD
jgi:DNA repair exonuclease SbcCD ATPase subunit